MPQQEVFSNGPSFNLIAPLTAGATTITPPSYTGWPASGQFRLLIDAEIALVTDASVHPWPIARGQEGTTATSHVAGGGVASQRLTAGALDHLVAVQQSGTLEAIGRVLDFTGGAVVTQEGDGVVGIAVAGTTAPIVFVIDGGGSAIATGSKGYVEVPFACTITANRLMADQVGSIVVTIKKANYATMPTTTSIVASAPPTLSSAQKSQDSTLTGWTTSIAAGDWLEYVVASASVVTRVTVSLTVRRV